MWWILAGLALILTGAPFLLGCLLYWGALETARAELREHQSHQGARRSAERSRRHQSPIKPPDSGDA